MNVKTFKAKTLADALRLVRDEFGPEARVLSTKDSNTVWSRLTGTQHVEVTALDYDLEQAPRVDRLVESTALESTAKESAAFEVASVASNTLETPPKATPVEPQQATPIHLDSLDDDSHDAAGPRFDYRSQLKQFAEQEAREELEASQVHASLLESMADTVEPTPTQKVPNTLFHLFSDLIEADVDEDFAKEVIDELQRHASPTQLEDANYLRKRASEWISGKVTVAPEIRAYPGQRRVVALIGPTGVGKTTTIAKLAANLRLRDKRRVGLITVDTYRIAAVDQLQAYADIIDLPMEVVSTPREMRNAVNRLSGVEIVLIDTAGRSPRDEIQLQELKSMLSEARPDEVHLVLSSVSSGRHLTRLVEQFTPVSPTSLVLTKLDESMTYGHLLPVACSGKLPLSYTTHGQNVPDDIQPASAATLVESVI